jgi:hypothetical protein
MAKELYWIGRRDGKNHVIRLLPQKNENHHQVLMRVVDGLDKESRLEYEKLMSRVMNANSCLHVVCVCGSRRRRRKK